MEHGCGGQALGRARTAAASAFSCSARVRGSTVGSRKGASLRDVARGGSIPSRSCSLPNLDASDTKDDLSEPVREPARLVLRGCAPPSGSETSDGCRAEAPGSFGRVGSAFRDHASVPPGEGSSSGSHVLLSAGGSPSSHSTEFKSTMPMRTCDT